MNWSVGLHWRFRPFPGVHFFGESGVFPNGSMVICSMGPGDFITYVNPKYPTWNLNKVWLFVLVIHYIIASRFTVPILHVSSRLVWMEKKLALWWWFQSWVAGSALGVWGKPLVLWIKLPDGIHQLQGHASGHHSQEGFSSPMFHHHFQSQSLFGVSECPYFKYYVPLESL